MMTDSQGFATSHSPDPTNRRRDERVPCQISVRYRLKAQGVLTSWKESQAGNISAGGIFMMFGEKIDVGSLMELELSVPGLVGSLKVIGRVAWTKGDERIVQCGLEFSDLRAEDRAFLAKYIESVKVNAKKE